MPKEDLIVPPEKLRWICDSKCFKFRNTLGVGPAHGFIGQERAVEALKFGLEIHNRDYHICVTGNTGRGKKKAILCEFIEEYSKERAVSGKFIPQDICYVHNFEKRDQPRILLFEGGGGKEFQYQMSSAADVFLSGGINKETIRQLGTLMDNLIKEYQANSQIVSYLNVLKADIFGAVSKLKRGDPLGADFLLPFFINVFVDNSATVSPPVIFEANPSFHNLFCEIEKEFTMGGYFTDHTRLRAGSIARANGGYLIMNMADILENYGVWQKLKKTLRQSALELEEPPNSLRFASLTPEQIPLNVKVVIVVDPEIYRLLVQYDPEFLTIFKVKAELDSEMTLSKKSKASYAGFVSACCAKEKLIPFGRTAVAKIVEQGARLAERQISLTTKLDEIKDLVIESSYWGKKSNQTVVGAKHVKEALRSQESRLNLIAEKSREMIGDRTFLIDTEGEKVGQINGLVIYNYGDFTFGLPNRITARTFAGDKGLISIQREVKLSGSIHDTGVLTLSGYFGEKYGKYYQISFSASISFEQCYGGIDGDSASAAELFCLISSLSGLPINQSFAVTGSMNQAGDIQPIGGVNQKIEGFFDVCKMRGLTGKQAVLIPEQNIQSLMLREDVVEACKNGKFRIFAIKHIDQGLEILTGINAEYIHEKVKERLSEISKHKK